MGLDTAAAKILCSAKFLGVDFSDTIMIGRQGFWPDTYALQEVFRLLGVQRDPAEFSKANPYAEEFFRVLGAQRVDSVDYSGYEGASHIQDMNLPVLADLRVGIRPYSRAAR
jgi:hypothetical protein